MNNPAVSLEARATSVSGIDGPKMQLGLLISLGHQLGLLLGSHAARQEAASGRARQP